MPLYGSLAKRTCLTAAAAVFCVFAAVQGCLCTAQESGRPHKEHRRAESHEIEALEEQWRVALLKNDATAIDKMTTDDFLSISSNGTLSDKQQYLGRISSHKNEFSTIDLRVLKVRVQPGSAIATSQTHVVGSLDGRPVDAVFRYTKVYTRSPGSAWRVANFEVTRVSPGANGSDSGMERGVPLDHGANESHPHLFLR